ncbi:MAG: protein kinase, partial [Proteobacteria bacterium]|nr:protein kinase [Pseudomonadota bacterium]
MKPKSHMSNMIPSSETFFPTRYQLHDKLGQGSMGIVYRATDRLTGKTIALKQVRVPKKLPVFMKGESEKLSKSFQLSLGREFQVMATLRHPNIISVLDYGFVHTENEPEPFFTMTYLPNATTLIEAAIQLPLEGKLDLLKQTLQGLAYLHRRKILHCDLKPDNVLVADGK